MVAAGLVLQCRRGQLTAKHHCGGNERGIVSFELIEQRLDEPAEMSSVIESAICAVTSAVRSLAAARDPDGCPACALRAHTRSGLVLASAGNRPSSGAYKP